MELKRFQKEVINDLRDYLDAVDEQGGNYATAFASYRENRGVKIDPMGIHGLKPYNDVIKGCPQVCTKVPTAGGKTFIACNALREIFNHFTITKEKVVVWLVPSRTILTQTIQNLSNPDHPYYQKIASHFGGKLEVLSKDDLLQGKGFTADSVKEQLTICVLSYDTFRSKNKDDRKIYQENSNLITFSDILNKQVTVEKADETSLMHILHHLNPVVIVDESHNTKSDLSIEMLQNLNPSFILDLSATPREGSNIISFIKATKLKEENMVKLPVLVYNQKTKTDVINNSLSIQRNLEKEAKKAHEAGGPYIRPIVLFQAEPKTSDDAETFEKIKEKLVKAGIPENQIAIKTANIDETTHEDLLSKDCEIRYIITVNALKEGRDCPFAYILASLANRSSTIDVTQIVGRILRLPYVRQHASAFLNMSYVFCASAKFYDTLESIVQGLNNAGFSSSKRAQKEETEIPTHDYVKVMEDQSSIFEDIQDEEDEIDETLIVTSSSEEDDEKRLASIKQMAQQEAERMEQEMSQEDNPTAFFAPELEGKTNMFPIKEHFQEQVKEIKLPQFFIEVASSDIFTNGQSEILLDKEALNQGFDLTKQDKNISFGDVESQVYTVDVKDESGQNSNVYYGKANKAQQKKLINYLDSIAPEKQVEALSGIIKEQLKSYNSIPQQDLAKYIHDIVASLSTDQLQNIKENTYLYTSRIKEKIDSLLEDYRMSRMTELIDTNKAFTKESYKFSKHISPTKTTLGIQKGLYTEESELNNFERDVINKIVGLDNIERWHKIIERQGFYLNGALNHYPDFVLKTTRGNYILTETKGDHLDNTDSKNKLILGKQRENLAGRNYKYFMVFDSNPINGAHTVAEFLKVLEQL